MNMINQNMRTVIREVIQSKPLDEAVEEIVHLYDIVITEYVQGMKDNLDADWRSALTAIDEVSIPAQRRMLGQRAQTLVTQLRLLASDKARA